MSETFDSHQRLSVVIWARWVYWKDYQKAFANGIRNPNSISWLVIIKDISVSCIFICHVLYIGSVTHIKRTLGTLYKGKIIRKFCRILAIRAADFHVLYSRRWYKKLSFLCRWCPVKLFGFSITYCISQAHIKWPSVVSQLAVWLYEIHGSRIYTWFPVIWINPPQ